MDQFHPRKFVSGAGEEYPISAKHHNSLEKTALHIRPQGNFKTFPVFLTKWSENLREQRSLSEPGRFIQPHHQVHVLNGLPGGTFDEVIDGRHCHNQFSVRGKG